MFWQITGRSLAGAVALGVFVAAVGACRGSGGGGGGGTTNVAPIADFSVIPSSGLAPLHVAVDAQSSSDPDGTIVSYVWDFGDGSAAENGSTATHDYPDVGAYTVTLTITDNDGALARTTREVVAMTSVAAEWYSVTEIPSLGGSYAEPRRINNKGQVTGLSYLANSQITHAFLYKDAITADLGTLGGDESWGTSLNGAGDVAGVAQDALSVNLAFVYHAGAMKSLGTLGGLTSEARGVNDAGQVVGRAETVAGLGQAFIYEKGAMRSLGTLGGAFSEAADINGKGQVVGDSYTATNEVHLFIYQNGAMVDAGGGVSGTGLAASAMNDSLDVVGMWVPPQGYAGYTGFLYRDDALGSLVDGYCEPIDVNNAGVVVGSAPFGNQNHAFVWDETKGMQDLNALIAPTLGITIQVAQGINDVGQIVGHGTRNNGGQNVAVLLTPTTKPTP